MLADVPADPNVPNAAVAAKIGSDREHALVHANADAPDGWSVDALSAWRRRREDAAEVRGAHRAATGVDDGDDLAAQRRAVRDDRGALAADLVYRATSPTEAVLAYEPVESLLAECAGYVEPHVPYPADPIAEPFRAGEAVARVERARAAATDAEGLRDSFLGERDDATPQWAPLVAGAGELRSSVSRTHATVRERTGGEDPIAEGDLSGTVAQELVATGDLRTESAVDDVRRAVDAGDHAIAVVDAGTALAEIEAYRTAVNEIRDGEHREAPSESSVRSAAERARAAVDEAVAHDDPLATRLVRPGLEVFEYAADRSEEGYGSARRTQASLVYVALYASAIPAAVGFVQERLE